MRAWATHIALVVLLLVTNSPLSQAQPSRGFRPSGFWTSPMPATHGSYRYRMLAIGVALAAVMGIIIMRAIKRANAENRQRNT